MFRLREIHPKTFPKTFSGKFREIHLFEKIRLREIPGNSPNFKMGIPILKLESPGNSLGMGWGVDLFEKTQCFSSPFAISGKFRENHPKIGPQNCNFGNQSGMLLTAMISGHLCGIFGACRAAGSKALSPGFVAQSHACLYVFDCTWCIRDLWMPRLIRVCAFGRKLVQPLASRAQLPDFPLTLAHPIYTWNVGSCLEAQ
jgi:hypothetical protein